MELSNLKKWVKPAVDALPPKRTIIIALILLIAFVIVMIPLFNMLIYPLKYEENIFNSAIQTKADPFLIMAIIRAETKFQPNQQSHVGAQGLMQIMPDTVDFIIRNGKFSPSLRDYVYDPVTNIQMGSWYIAYLTERYHGNKVAVMAAYNAGHGRVDKWLREGVWDGTRQNVMQIPEKYGETRHYVTRVSYYYEKYKQLYQDEFEEYKANLKNQQD
ncbi:lytic transglycosylase domain-containing protein [Thermoactinomyces mirandus]|uniref:Lytic transglycosylase domain-containing protein n=1 Tax=Thermoactinomyces mirandus TaxID=2756294 RepID=A0A7W1XQZ3_9BACL|nr:lytic transglycosylase domain-containing protein [Thermoactinomyces mirandus]MBA4601634.1 lytic transglycosylase domain-containing protein [Thermoactinomyces mirandus]